MLQRRGNRLELYRHRTWGAFLDNGFDSDPQKAHGMSGLPCTTLYSLLCDKSPVYLASSQMSSPTPYFVLLA